MGMIADTLAQEIEHEARSTRAMLALVPADRFDYKPHEKSMPLMMLASHLAESLDWLVGTIRDDRWEMDEETYQPFVAGSVEELLATFDSNLAAGLEALRDASDEHMMGVWTMTNKATGAAFFSMPRAAVVRAFICNHVYHHRGQLSVYLRLLDQPLPQVYGPTADHPEMPVG